MSDDSKKIDDLARAAWPEAVLGLSKQHLAQRGVTGQVELSKGLLILTGRNQDGHLYFRGTLDAAMIWLAGLPPLEPPKYADPLADFRASINEKLASIADEYGYNARKGQCMRDENMHPRHLRRPSPRPGSDDIELPRPLTDAFLQRFGGRP
jgi:hypothetical protein